MTDTFRALCAELADDLEEWVNGYLINDYANKATAASFERIGRARAVYNLGREHGAAAHKREQEIVRTRNGSPVPAGDVPLWELMLEAFSLRHGDDKEGMAAELRCVADCLERRQMADYAVVLPDVREVLGWLRAEAERAEAGE